MELIFNKFLIMNSVIKEKIVIVIIFFKEIIIFLNGIGNKVDFNGFK